MLLTKLKDLQLDRSQNINDLAPGPPLQWQILWELQRQEEEVKACGQWSLRIDQITEEARVSWTLGARDVSGSKRQESSEKIKTLSFLIGSSLHQIGVKDSHDWYDGSMINWVRGRQCVAEVSLGRFCSVDNFANRRCRFTAPALKKPWKAFEDGDSQEMKLDLYHKWCFDLWIETDIMIK